MKFNKRGKPRSIRLKKNKFYQLCIFTSLLAAFYPSAFANRTYQVNVVVFKYLTPAGNALAESWQCQHISPNLKNTITLASANTSNQTSSPFYRLLPESLRGLKQEASRLQNQPGYQVIGRWSWIQPRSSHGRLIHLYGGTLYESANADNGTNIWELDGKIKISIGEYITTFTQLYLTEPSSTLKGIINQSISNHFCTFKISDSRPVKLNDINYIDHPLFGILLQVKARQ